MRFMDVLLAFPALLLAIFIVTVLGKGLFNAVIAISIVTIPIYARVVRASVLTVREQEFVAADRALGVSSRRILTHRVLPNSLTPLVVPGTLGIATAVLEIAALSFLGLGVQPPTAEWGSMLAAERQQLLQRPASRHRPRHPDHAQRARLQSRRRRPARRPRPEAKPVTTRTPPPDLGAADVVLHERRRGQGGGRRRPHGRPAARWSAWSESPARARRSAWTPRSDWCPSPAVSSTAASTSTASTCWRCRAASCAAMCAERVAMVFQQPNSSLNPCYDAGFQIGEVYEIHRKARKRVGASGAPSRCCARSTSPTPSGGPTATRTSCRAAGAAGDDRHGARRRAPSC